jgi:hypothetical protein
MPLDMMRARRRALVTWRPNRRCTMSMDTNQVRSRRALLGAGLGAAAATAAAALPAVAKVSTTPSDVTGYLRVDAPNTGTGVTELSGGTNALKVDCTHGRAIDAVSGDGTAVRADGGTGFGVYAVASLGGFALSTHGRLDLSTAGVATIPPGATSKVVFGGVDITAGSFVLLTPALDIGTRRLWWTKDTVGNSFTIHLSSSRPTNTKVSWLLLG